MVRLRAATWNIWGRFGDWEQRWPGIVREMRRAAPDVVGLVENWRDGDQNQVRLLADELDYEHWASADVALGNELPWGVGVLSRLPIVAVSRLEFPNPGAGRLPGVALLTSIEAGFDTFEFACMCEWGSLGRSLFGPRESSDRLPSYRVLAADLAALDREVPPLLVGDLNALPDSDELRALTGKVSHADLELGFNDAWALIHGPHGGWTLDAYENPYLAQSPGGRFRIDYVMTGIGPRFTRLWRVNHAERFGLAAYDGVVPSDHYGVLADVELVERLHPSVSRLESDASSAIHTRSSATSSASQDA